jgi:hypothetical protein
LNYGVGESFWDTRKRSCWLVKRPDLTA